MDEKVKVVIELDKAFFQAIMLMVKGKLTDEMWHKLSLTPVVLDWDNFDEGEALKMKMTICCMAIFQVSKNERN
nr:MAG TPA: hypothetical protein [Caudoviricetes sp.]